MTVSISSYQSRNPYESERQDSITNETENMDDRRESSQPCGRLFCSTEFSKFLSKEFPSHATFLSKDDGLPTFEAPNIFKSREVFSQIFSSSDWKMPFTQTKPSVVDSSSPGKTMPIRIHTPARQRLNATSTLDDILSSRDWVACNTLGPHVDVSINHDILATGEAQPSPLAEVPAAQPRPRTDWNAMFFSQLDLVPSPVTTSTTTPLEEPVAILVEPPPSTNPPLSPPQQPHPTLPAEELTPERAAASIPASQPPSDGQGPRANKKKKRVRKPRQKVIPKEKAYVTPTENDVLLGRGGRSNHHIGNKRYREEVKNLRTWYLSIGDNKEEKTALSQWLVDYVHGYKGRFLEKDSSGWYVVPNIVARRKASQALREDDDPEKRAAKRARFLQKRIAETQSSGEE